MKKAFLYAFSAALFLMFGCGIAKSFLKDFSLLDASFWFCLWPIPAALFFGFAAVLFWKFGETMANRKK